MALLRLCVVCDNVAGGTQIVQGSPESYSELIYLLQRHLRFRDPRCNRITGVHVYNTIYNEWVPVDAALGDIAPNSKIRVQCDVDDTHPKAAQFYEEIVALFLQALPNVDRQHELEDAIDAAKALSLQDKEASVFDMRAKPSFQTVASLIKGGKAASSSNTPPNKEVNRSLPDVSTAVRSAAQTRNKAAPQARSFYGADSSPVSYKPAAFSTSQTGLHGTSPSKQSAAATTSPRTGAYRPNTNSNSTTTTADIAPTRSAAGSGVAAVAAVSASPAYRKAARAPTKAANPSSTPLSPQPLASTTPSSNSSTLTIFCVYSGTTSQRAKAIQVQRSDPGYDAIINVLRQKFNSDLSLGHISADGECTEISNNDELKRLTATCGTSLTLHCWAKAGVHFNELSMASGNGSMISRPQSAYGSEYGEEDTPSRTPNKRTPNKRPSSRASNASVARSHRSAASAVSFTPANDRDVSGTAWNPRQLREVFEALDVDGSGYLTKDEMMDYFRRYHDDMGIVDAEKKFSKMLDQCAEMDDGQLTFEEFSVIMLRVAQW